MSLVQDRPEVVARASLLGGFELCDLDGRSLLPRSRKAVAILAYVSYHRDTDVSRGTLIDLCWSDRERAQGQSSLRQGLLEIRAALGALESLVIEVDRLRVKLNGRALDFAGESGEGLAGDPATLLSGVEPVSPVFDEWVEQERRVLVTREVGRAERALARAPAKSAEALAAAETILRLEPQNETAGRAAMAAHAAHGEVTKAIRVYKALCAALQEDGFDVSDTTRRLMDEMRTSSMPAPARPVAAPAVGAAGPPVLAILPVRMPAGAAELARRFTDEITARMTDVREVRTLSQAQGMRLDHSGEAMLQGAEEIGADYVLTSSADGVDGETAGIHQLFAVPGGEQVWSLRTRFDPTNAGMSIRRVLERLTGELVPAIEQHGWTRRLSADRTAWTGYHHYLKAKALIAHPADASYMDVAEPLLEKAIELDPGFGPPYAHLIASYNSSRHNTAPGSDRVAGINRAFELARRFLILDARNSSAHLALAWCHLRRRQFDMAERSLERAIELDPYDPNRINSIGTAYVYLGEFDRGEEYYNRASRLMIHDIDTQQTDYGELYYFRREYETALGYFRVGELRNPLRPRVLVCATLAQVGRLAEARQEAEAVMDIFRARWRGSEPFTPRAALRWYIEDFTLRRRVDVDNLVEGLTKAGFIL